MGNFYYVRSYFDVFYPRYMLIFVHYLLFLPKPARFAIHFWKIREKIFSTEIFQICDSVFQSFAKLSKSTLILHILDIKMKIKFENDVLLSKMAQNMRIFF